MTNCLTARERAAELIARTELGRQREIQKLLDCNLEDARQSLDALFPIFGITVDEMNVRPVGKHFRGHGQEYLADICGVRLKWRFPEYSEPGWHIRRYGIWFPATATQIAHVLVKK